MRRQAWLVLTCLLGMAIPGMAEGPGTLRVAAVQMRSTRDLDANIARMKHWLQQCAERQVQVAVFPECSLTGYFEDVARATTEQRLRDAERQIAAACREHQIAAIVGSPWREGEKLFNSALVITEQGEVIERYYKVQLAENWPSGGDHLSVFRLRGVPCSIIICHDERYPELVRLPVLAGSRCVFYLSHESGVTQESKLNPYRAQIQARAVENNVFIAHANAPANADASGSHGQSRLIAPDGNILEEAGMFDEAILVADFEIGQATARNALNSIHRGPLGEWWKDAVKTVRRIGH